MIPRPLVIFLLCIPWALAVYGLGTLILLRFPPSGVFETETMLNGKSPWIFPFLPSERATSPGMQPDGWTGQRITGDPVYFTAHVPGPYERAVVSLEYRVLRQPLLEFGVVRDAAGTQLDLSPMYSAALDTPGWTRGGSGATEGFVSKGTGLSRLSDTNPHGKAVWDTTTTMPMLMDTSSEAIATDISLRGSHDFHFVPSNNAVHATFWFQDANRKEGSDAIVFRVFRGDEELPQYSFVLNASNERRMGLLQDHEIVIPNTERGVYRIAFIAPDDVFLRKISTTSKRWVIGPRVYFGDTVGYANGIFPGNIWTDSMHAVAETFHTEGLQTLSLGSSTIAVKSTHTPIRIDRTDTSGPILLRAPKGDVRLILDGFAALRSEAFFEPKPRRLTDATDLVREGIDAVLTSYVPPEKIGDGWMRSTFAISIPSNVDVIRFVLAAPGIASRLGAVDVRKISVSFERPAVQFTSWMKTMKLELANAWHRF